MKETELKSPKDNQVNSLLKSITTLINLYMLYLAVTWSYEGLSFIIRSIVN